MAPSSDRTLLIATTSPGKLREWQELLVGTDYRLLGLADLGIDFDVEETGTTFRANALLKAEAYGKASGLLTLAEDSGLVVAALGGQPGVYSARWEGDDYAHKNAVLLRLLAGQEGAARACHYACVAVLRHPDGGKWSARGAVHGRIAMHPAGSGGFGYDPIFFVPRLGKTLAEISDAQKHRISHRGRAAAYVRAYLERLLAEGQAG